MMKRTRQLTPFCDLEAPRVRIQTSCQEFQEAVYQVTKMIPRGQVATYGQIATYVFSPRYARAVGNALRHLPKGRTKEVPWQRVINSSAKISLKGDIYRPVTQLRLLKKEGIKFNESGKTQLDIFGWSGPPQGFTSMFVLI